MRNPAQPSEATMKKLAGFAKSETKLHIQTLEGKRMMIANNGGDMTIVPYFAWHEQTRGLEGDPLTFCSVSGTPFAAAAQPLVENGELNKVNNASLLVAITDHESKERAPVPGPWKGELYGLFHFFQENGWRQPVSVPSASGTEYKESEVQPLPQGSVEIDSAESDPTNASLANYDGKPGNLKAEILEKEKTGCTMMMAFCNKSPYGLKYTATYNDVVKGGERSISQSLKALDTRAILWTPTVASVEEKIRSFAGSSNQLPLPKKAALIAVTVSISKLADDVLDGKINAKSNATQALFHALLLKADVVLADITLTKTRLGDQQELETLCYNPDSLLNAGCAVPGGHLRLTLLPQTGHIATAQNQTFAHQVAGLPVSNASPATEGPSKKEIKEQAKQDKARDEKQELILEKVGSVCEKVEKVEKQQGEMAKTQATMNSKTNKIETKVNQMTAAATAAANSGPPPAGL